MNPVVLVTDKEFNKARAIFSTCPDFECRPAPPEEHRLAGRLTQDRAVATIVGVDAYRNELYRALPAGSVIARFGVGHDGINKAMASAAGLICTHTPGVLDNSVAEHAVLLMGCLARHVAAGHCSMRQRGWEPSVGGELSGKRLLVVGCGAIGCKMARIASWGFGMRVDGYDTSSPDPEVLLRDFGITLFRGALEEALATADFVSLHIPSTPATRHFVNRRFLEAMPPQAMLINTARGAILHEADLYHALKDGKIAGAALDVFENEPYRPVASEQDFRDLPNVLLTPHIGSSTVEACRRMALCCLENIRNARTRQFAALDVLNPEVLDNRILLRGELKTLGSEH